MMKAISFLLLAAAAACAQAQTADSTAHAWTLRECIDHAINHNISVRQAANTADQNRIEENTARWARLPGVSASAGQNWSWGRAVSPADNSYTNVNNANTSLSLGASLPLFTGLQLPNQHALARLNLQAAIEDLNKAKEDIAVTVTSAYLQALFNQELEAVAWQQVALSQAQRRRLRGLFGNGKASPSEVAEAESRVAQDSLTAVQAQNTARLSLLDLSQLLELPSPEGFRLEAPDEEPAARPLTPPDEIYTQALAYKPGIRAAEYRLEGAGHSLRIAQSAFYPQLSLSAGIGSSYYTLNGRAEYNFSRQLKNNLSKYVGLNLSIPLFNRLSTRNRVRASRLQQAAMELQLADAKKSLYKEIQQAWYNALAAQSKYQSCQVAVKATREAFRLAEGRYNNQQATALEYNEAKLNLTRALSDRLQAKYDYLFRVKILDFYKGIMIE